jgi:predicted RNA-binding Zn ribbon-like protein
MCSTAHGTTRSQATRPLVRRVAVAAAMAMIDLIRADQLSRLSGCADDQCDGLVLDLSRHYCSTTCANRNAVAVYRARARGRE